MAEGELVALLVERGCDAREIRMTSAGCSRSNADEPSREPERPKWRVLNSMFFAAARLRQFVRQQTRDSPFRN